jgi:DnaJ homolog subfamily C member 17
MANDDLKAHATSSHDFYALLSITPETPQAEVRRAYRKTALKYHPDKHPDNPSAIETFHLLQIAYDVLSDPAVKALYDNARNARAAKARQSELFDGERRRMKEDLERREKGSFGSVKRKWGEEDPEEKLEREIRRLQEDGARRRREREEMLRREKLEEEEDANPEPAEATMPSTETHTSTSETNVPEIDRTIKVRWPREGSIGSTLTKDSLATLFSKFGKIENVFLLKDKKVRVSKREKKLMATGVVEFRSIVGAHAAVEDAKKQTGDLWGVIESVCWAGNKEPEAVRMGSPPVDAAGDLPSSSAPSTPVRTASKPPNRFSFIGLNPTPATTDSNGLKRVPSFASFTSSTSTFNTPSKGSPFGKGAGSPSLEEITLIRLKNAERKRLEEEIRRKEEEDDKAEC